MSIELSKTNRLVLCPVHTINMTRLSCRQCEQNSRLDKTVWKFSVDEFQNCFVQVSNSVHTSYTDKIRQSCLCELGFRHLKETNKGTRQTNKYVCHVCLVVWWEFSFTKQHSLEPAKGQWCSLAGKVIAGLMESNGSLSSGGWLKSPAGWLYNKHGWLGVLHFYHLTWRYFSR